MIYDWIKISEILPEIGREVQVFTINNEVTALTRFINLNNNYGYYWDNYYGGNNLHLPEAVTHWKPLSDPPSNDNIKSDNINWMINEIQKLKKTNWLIT